ncbi:MAG: GlsB/YeaQ/YmgE family stress response membrane protein [Verrucomicrobia bacterium]|nr:GlsB/YeaQ/YmgE family stress response membrane protein [Verrucomicrobiota bacterium]
MSLLVALIIGLVVGALAKLIVPGREPGGCLVTALIGIGGSFVAYFIGRALGLTTEGPHHFLRPVGFIPSLIGAIILLVIYHAIRGRRPPGT